MSPESPRGIHEEYSPEYDVGIIWNDPEVGIDWPIEQSILSTKDSGLPSLREAQNDFIYGDRRSKD